MTVKQIALPDVSVLASAGATIFFMEAVTFTDDAKHLLVKATFIEDGTGGAQRYGYYLYDIANEIYVLNLNAELLSVNRLITSNIEALSFSGNIDDYTAIAQVRSADSQTSKLVRLENGEITSADILLDALNDDFSVNVESFALAEDGRHLAIQTTDPNLASVLNPDTNDASDIYLLDMQTQAILRISEVGGAEVIADTDLQNIAIVDGTLQIAFTTDEAYVSPTRVDQNTTDITGPLGTRTDAYVWVASLDTSGLLLDNGQFTLISQLPNNTASGFVEPDSGISLSDNGAFFSSASEFVDSNDNNNAIDSFSFIDGSNTTLAFNGERFDADSKLVGASASGRYVTLLSSASQVSGSTGAQQLVFIDVQTGASRIVSQNAAGSVGDVDTISGVIANSGAFVAFSSLASNLTNDVPNTFQGSLFIREYTDINSAPEGRLELASLPLMGQDLALDFTHITDADGLANEFDVTWTVNGNAVASDNNVLSREILNLDSIISAEVSYTDNAGNNEILLVDDFTLFDRPSRDDGSVDFSAKYIVFASSGENIFDFDLGLSSINYDGQATVFSGSSDVEIIKISSGQILDITNLKGSQDKVFLPGELSDYLTHSSISSATNEMTLISTAGFSYTEVKFIATPTASDVLVFSDGQVKASDFKAFLLNDKAAISDLELDNSVTNDDIPSSTNDAKIKAIALDPNGETFTSFTPATSLQVSGSVGVDKVYVREGTTVDATNLKSSVDEIYLQGTWSDYAKHIDNSGNLLLSRTLPINGTNYDELVTVASGSTISTNDLLVFADGAIRTQDAVAAVKADDTSVFSALTGFNGLIVTPMLENVIDTDFIFPSAAGKYVDEALIQAVIGLAETEITANEQALVVPVENTESLSNPHQESISMSILQSDGYDNDFEIMF